MSVRVDPIVLHIRGYDDGIDIHKSLPEMAAPYRFHCLVTVTDNGIGRVQGLNATVTHRDFSEICAKLKKLGVLRIEWRHKSRDHSKAL